MYFGGTLKQHVDGQYDLQEYAVKDGLIKGLIGPNILGVSTHHQAVDSVGKNLKIVIDYVGIPKALEGPNMLWLQFHPEWSVDEEMSDHISFTNRNFLLYLATQG